MTYFIGVVLLALNVYLVYHALESGAEFYWSIFILLVPIVGALSYIMFVWIPALDLQFESRYDEGLYSEEVSATGGSGGGNVSEKMRVLKAMLDDELITAEDYEKKKGEILAGM